MCTYIVCDLLQRNELLLDVDVEANKKDGPSNLCTCIALSFSQATSSPHLKHKAGTI